MPQTPPTGVTTFKLAVPVQLTPASVSVVPRAVFESQDAFVLGDALRNVSGVSVATGFGVFDFFTIRGFDSLSSALVLTDGAFEPESTFYPLYNVRQVEVVKGPAAFLYGANPLSGAVHLVRKQPVAGTLGDGQRVLRQLRHLRGRGRRQPRLRGRLAGRARERRVPRLRRVPRRPRLAALRDQPRAGLASRRRARGWW